MKKYSKDYHFGLTDSLHKDIIECIAICERKYEVTMSRAEFIRMAVEHLINHTKSEKKTHTLEKLLRDMRYI